MKRLSSIFAATFLGLFLCVMSLFAYNNGVNITISLGVLREKAVHLVVPDYSPAAKAVSASGTVKVKITIDEKGNVVSAKAVSGHPLLKASSEDAARKAQFTPTLLSGKPVKVTEVIAFNFALPKEANK